MRGAIRGVVSKPCAEHELVGIIVVVVVIVGHQMLYCYRFRKNWDQTEWVKEKRETEFYCYRFRKNWDQTEWVKEKRETEFYSLFSLVVLLNSSRVSFPCTSACFGSFVVVGVCGSLDVAAESESSMLRLV